MYVDIFSIPLSKINSIAPEIDEEFITALSQQIPTYFKVYPSYWLVNTNLTVNSMQQMRQVQVFNVLLQYSLGKCKHLQITKN